MVLFQEYGAGGDGGFALEEVTGSVPEITLFKLPSTA